MTSLYSLIARIAQVLHMPQSLFLYALIAALLVPLLILAAGVVIRALSDALTGVIAALLGRRMAFVIRNYLSWPGTVIHEFSHALVAFLTGARIEHISLLPHGSALGSVTFRPRGGRFLQGLQKSLSAIAPTVIGSLLLALAFTGIYPLLVQTWQHALFWYLVLSVLFHMDLSDADLDNLRQGFLSLFSLFYVLSLLFLRQMSV